jgi:ABC-type transporter Mla subunit MlaD
MSAQPSEPPAWYDEVDRRLTALEGNLKHVLPFEIAATEGPVGIVHDELRAVGQQVTRHGQRLDQVAAELETVARSQIEHGAALAQMAGKVDGLDAKADGLDAKVVGLDAKVTGLSATVEGHTTMLAEILRRLPEPPAPDDNLSSG